MKQRRNTIIGGFNNLPIIRNVINFAKKFQKSKPEIKKENPVYLIEKESDSDN